MDSRDATPSAVGLSAAKLSLAAATALVIAEVVGVGIFLTPDGMAKSIGSPLWVSIVWLLMGGSALAGALCIGSLAALFPQVGGVYVYLREGYGRWAAFLFGWMSLLVIDPALVATLATGAAPISTPS